MKSSDGVLRDVMRCSSEKQVLQTEIKKNFKNGKTMSEAAVSGLFVTII